MGLQIASVSEDELFRVEVSPKRCTLHVTRCACNRGLFLGVRVISCLLQTIDWTGGQIKDSDSAEDMKSIDLTVVHHLSGPIAVKDKAGKPAMPGDLLVVEICNLGALPGDEWGGQINPIHVALNVMNPYCTSSAFTDQLLECTGFTGTFGECLSCFSA